MTEEETTPPTEAGWVVHVAGPDDVLPATGMLDAFRQAHEINSHSMAGYYNTAVDRPFMTYCWASPQRESDLENGR